MKGFFRPDNTINVISFFLAGFTALTNLCWDEIYFGQSYLIESVATLRTAGLKKKWRSNKSSGIDPYISKEYT